VAVAAAQPCRMACYRANTGPAAPLWQRGARSLSARRVEQAVICRRWASSVATTTKDPPARHITPVRYPQANLRQHAKALVAHSRHLRELANDAQRRSVRLREMTRDAEAVLMEMRIEAQDAAVRQGGR
jgi:hypothetical protein